MDVVDIRELGVDGASWAQSVLEREWGGRTIVSRTRVHDALALPGLVAVREGARCGLLTYHADGDAMEIVSLHADPPHVGVGTELLRAAMRVAARAGCRRLWLVTSNDNLDALRFYQRRGFRLVAVHRDAITGARRRKPTIPLVGAYGIPICDELELERAVGECGNDDGGLVHHPTDGV